jgi:transposase
MGRFVEVLSIYKSQRMSCLEAALMMGVSERHFRRMRDRYEDEGIEGLVDKRLGKASARRVPVDRVEEVLRDYKTTYRGMNALHFHEKLVEKGFKYSYSWTKALLQSRGLITRSPQKGGHRTRRERRAMRGMMLFQDGSTHEWLLGQANIDLIVTLDDATSEITSMFFVAQEGTVSTLRGIKETIESKGLFSSFYTDRGSHYFHTPQAGGKVDKENLTQVGRALKQLGIQHIASYCPQGRGRMERVFGTLQGRLPHDLRLAGIEDVNDANIWLKNTYMAQHNTRFAVKPTEEISAYVPFIGDLDQILCLQEERVVGQDNCVRYNNKTLQIPQDKHRYHYVKATVLVREYLDKSLSLFHGPRLLAKYNRFGELEMPLENSATAMVA